MTNWIQQAWGRFRSYQRTLPAEERLSRADLQVAWGLWKILSSSLGEEEVKAARAHTKAQDEQGRLACRTFALWLQENQESLNTVQERAVAESAHMTDHVAVEVIR